MLQDVFPDKATERKILSLVIKCPSEGCGWTGELRNKEVAWLIQIPLIISKYPCKHNAFLQQSLWYMLLIRHEEIRSIQVSSTSSECLFRSKQRTCPNSYPLKLRNRLSLNFFFILKAEANGKRCYLFWYLGDLRDWKSKHFWVKSSPKSIRACLWALCVSEMCRYLSVIRALKCKCMGKSRLWKSTSFFIRLTSSPRIMLFHALGVQQFFLYSKSAKKTPWTAPTFWMSLENPFLWIL